MAISSLTATVIPSTVSTGQKFVVQVAVVSDSQSSLNSAALWFEDPDLAGTLSLCEQQGKTIVNGTTYLLFEGVIHEQRYVPFAKLNGCVELASGVRSSFTVVPTVTAVPPAYLIPTVGPEGWLVFDNKSPSGHIGWMV
jgi:hypothetical protein